MILAGEHRWVMDNNIKFSFIVYRYLAGYGVSAVLFCKSMRMAYRRELE